MRVKLKEICIPKQWKTISTNELGDSGYPVYGANGIIGYYNEYNHEVDTLLVTCRGATCGSLNISKGKAYVNGNAMALDDLRNDIDIKYLYYYLKCRGFKDVISGSAQPQIIRSAIEEIEVEIKDKEEQESIVSKCERIERLVDKIKKLQNYLDTLIKARFVEMFGDVSKNSKDWISDKMGNYMTLLTDFSSNGSYKLLDSNVIMKDEPNYAWMVRTTDLEENEFEKIKYVDEQTYNFLGKSKLYGDEIIMCKIGSAGRIFLMPKVNKPATLGRNAFMFRYDDRINRVYLYYYLTTEHGKQEIMSKVRGAVTKTITKDDARCVKILVPPKNLQDEFETFVEKIEKAQKDVKLLLDKINLLFDGFMQKYFT